MDSASPTPTRAQLVHAADALVAKGRAVEVEKMEVLLAFGDTCSGDPQQEPGAAPARKGGPRLITLGGDGTPQVADLHLAEIAVARHEGVFTTRNALADGFDLRHRLPQVWEGVRDLRCDLWVARRVAAMSRKLTLAQVATVDESVAAALDESPGRILEIAEAKVIEADPEAHEQRIRRNRQHKGVWVSRCRSGQQVEEAGVAGVFARIDEADADQVEQMVEHLAHALAEHAAPLPEDEQPPTMDHWRSEAFAMLLADPTGVLAFLDSLEQGGANQGDTSPDGDEAPAEPKRRASSDAVVYVHVAHDPARGCFGPVARVEGLGPRLLTEVRDLLRHRSITLTPVIDLNAGRSVNAYEHPADVKLRSELRTVGDVFPHSANRSHLTGRRPDHDHPRPYDTGGPPGQTGDHNDAPLTRHHHRAKTHLGYAVEQVGPNHWLWRTPHGLHRLVGTDGTAALTTGEATAVRALAIHLAGELALGA